MARFLVFLRAINLGATRKFPKDAILAATESAGFADVATHIASGNVRVETSIRSRSRIESALEQSYAADRGFEVPCIAFSVSEFLEVAAVAEELAKARPGMARHYVYLLKEQPSADVVEQIEATSSERGDMVVRGRAAHALLRPGYEAGIVDPLNAAKMLGVATNRNINVVRTLAQKWCAPGS